MKKFLLVTALLLSVVALSAMIPTNSDAYSVVYGPTWGYYSGWGYPATSYGYGWGHGYGYWPGGAYYKVYPRRFKAYRGFYYGGPYWWYYY